MRVFSSKENRPETCTMLRPFVLNEDEASAEAVTFPKAHIPEFVIISVNVDPVLRGWSLHQPRP